MLEQSNRPMPRLRPDDSAAECMSDAEGFEELYPVQATTWTLLAGGFSDAHDLCICVPTGSGKTLAYALPILQGLTGQVPPYLRPTEHRMSSQSSSHTVWLCERGCAETRDLNCRRARDSLGALVVLPTRELALQVSTPTILF